MHTKIFKIVSDGTPQETYLFDENGKEVKHIKKIVWHIDSPKDLAKIEVIYAIGSIEAFGEVEVCEKCGQIVSKKDEPS